MSNVVQFRPRTPVPVKVQLMLDESILRSRIVRQEKITQAYQNLVDSGEMPIAQQIVLQCQLELDCMIAQYTGSFGELR